MFLVFNKDKIYTYCISIITVVLLFCVANMMLDGYGKETIAASSQISKLLPVYKVSTQEKKVALTLNCAWNDSDITSILETLKRQNCKVTFFMVGEWVKKFPEAAKKIKEAGHEIASHSNTHPHVTQMTYEQNVQEIEESIKILQDTTGATVKLYRPPYGEYNDTVIQAANDKGLIPIQWSLDTLDYTNLTGEQMWKRIEGKLSNGDIILMHNGTTHTADSLEMILQNVKNKGYEIVPVSDLVYHENYIIDINGIQKNK